MGNLDAYRDFTDFRDAVKAYWLALAHCTPGEAYNLGSGKAIQLKSALDELITISGLNVRVERDPRQSRPSDIPYMVCDNSKFCAATGWAPVIPFNRTIKDLLSYWQDIIEEAL